MTATPRRLRSPAPPRPGAGPGALARRGTLAGLQLGVHALALLCLAACGPGLGGTGTGDNQPAEGTVQFSVKVCDSAVAGLLGCGGNAAASANADATGVLLADGHPGATQQALLQGAQLAWQLRCAAWRFEGQWATSQDWGPAWYGQLTRADGSTQAALAQAQTGPGPSSFNLQLRAWDGQVLATSPGLQPVPSETVAAPCP